ncbi:hypothetical protein [Paracoccus shanxieyensis]|uniref:hypothetical protein n=1 Tax=Paracoccus shanxieyensis TaxID=2675752 RepID=UPI001394E366|nr:hypothetical protein [Paracoccus shanxieyensis]MTH86656.1 hypothetical protein [Paracoccus shanxieyensis]
MSDMPEIHQDRSKTRPLEIFSYLHHTSRANIFNEVGKGRSQPNSSLGQAAPIMHRDVDRLGTKQQGIDKVPRGPSAPAQVISALEQPRIPRLCKLVRPQRHGLQEIRFDQPIRERCPHVRMIDQCPSRWRSIINLYCGLNTSPLHPH